MSLYITIVINDKSPGKAQALKCSNNLLLSTVRRSINVNLLDPISLSLTYKIRKFKVISMEHIEKMCRQYGITPNQLYVLWCVSMKRKPLEDTRVALDIRLMQTKGLISITDTNSVKLTTLGTSLVSQMNEMFKKRWKLKDITSESGFQERVNEYREIWPKVSVGEGTNKRPLRSSPAEITRAFKNFFTAYPETTWEQVYAGTKSYLRKWFNQDDKTYMKNASSFVYKEKSQTISELAKEIELFDSQDLDIPDPVIIPKSK